MTGGHDPIAVMKNTRFRQVVTSLKHAGPLAAKNTP